MATLTVWKFPTPGGAMDAERKILALQQQALIKVIDAAVVTWPADKKKPKTIQLNSMTAAGAAGGAFWGLLFGILFFVPLLGVAVGAAMGALSGSLVDVGIDDNFIANVREKITPGTSALFLMSSDAVIEKVSEAFTREKAELVQSNLAAADEEALRAIFADD